MSTELYADRSSGVENQGGTIAPYDVVATEALAAEQSISVESAPAPDAAGEQQESMSDIGYIEIDPETITIDSLREARDFTHARHVYAVLLPKVSLLPEPERENGIRELDAIMLSKRQQDRAK